MTKQGKTNGLIGIDLGTSSVKVLLTDLEGNILARHSKDYPTHQPIPGWFEQAPKDWWKAVASSVDHIITDFGESLDIRSIGLSGQMHGTLLLDHKHQPLYPAIIWQDQRSSKHVEQINQLISRSRLISITGSPAATGFQAMTIRWIQQNKPDLWKQTAYILLPKDYLRLQMTGELASDPSDGSGTLLFDVSQRTWSTELLNLFEIDKTLLPPIQPSISVAGELTPSTAEAFNLSPGIPVVTGAADTACAMLGAGLLDPRKLLVNISTGGQVVLPCWQVELDMQGRSHTFCSTLEPQPGQAGWFRMGATLSAGGSLQWLRDNLLELSGRDAYPQMTALTATSPPGANRLIFLPYLAGERTPHMDSAARGSFIGLSLHHQNSDLVRAVMEGVVFSLLEASLTLRSASIQPDSIILAGGGSRSRLWQQIVADVFNLPVTPLLISEQSALGAAILAGLGMQLISLEQVPQSWARYGDTIEPDPRNISLYASLFDLYQKAYLNLQETFSHVSKID
jgi:xylulokinase